MTWYLKLVKHSIFVLETLGGFSHGVAACEPAGQANARGWELAQEGLERPYTEELRPRGLPQAFRPSRCSLPGAEAPWPQENWVGGGKAASQACEPPGSDNSQSGNFTTFIQGPQMNRYPKILRFNNYFSNY